MRIKQNNRIIKNTLTKNILALLYQSYKKITLKSDTMQSEPIISDNVETDHQTASKIIQLYPKYKLNFTWLYFFLVALYSLIFYLPAIFMEGSTYEFPKIILFMIGAAGPSVIGVILVHTTYPKEQRKDFWRRVFSFKKLGIIWFVIVFLANVIPTLVSIIVGVILKTQGTTFFGLAEFFSNAIGVLITIGFAILTIFAEELGWRGFALDGLQSRIHPSLSSLILAAYWLSWHFPLFFMEGTYQNGLGFGSNEFILFCFGIFSTTIIMTWIFNNSNKSILSAMLFHFFTNTFGEMFEFDIVLESIRIAVYCAFALVIIIYWIYQIIAKKEVLIINKDEIQILDL